MNDLLQLACLIGVGALPLVVLGLRAARPKFMPWGAVLLLVIGLGWVGILFGAMLNETKNGGSGHVGALFFGWAIALIWLAPWLFVYAAIERFRRRAIPHGPKKFAFAQIPNSATFVPDSPPTLLQTTPTPPA
jgi:hypothetical protein